MVQKMVQRVVLKPKYSGRLSEQLKDSEELTEALRQADTICGKCKPLSPTFCTETCEIWRTKHQLLEMNGKLSEADYETDVFNAVKNDRRHEVLGALFERSRTLEELQKHLKSKGFSHSQHTISSEYVEPLVDVGLVNKSGGKFGLTLYGQKFYNLLSRLDLENPLPPHSNCYEEALLRELSNGPKSYAELQESVDSSSLSRPLKRLLDSGLISKSRHSNYIFYFRTKKTPKKAFSPTEKKAYQAIPREGIAVPELSKKVEISVRRTYKYLRRLRRRRLVFTRKKPRTYELTLSGKELADFLEDTINLISDALKASTYLVEHSG